MSNQTDKLIIVCGPTATGKTSLALKLADELNGECINADSRQVYKGMDIGTGKDLPLSAVYSRYAGIRNSDEAYSVGYYTINDIPLWLYDISTPDRLLSVALYREAVITAIKVVSSKGKIPILVGGTGFYLASIVRPPETISVPPDPALRERLSALPVPALQAELKRMNPDRFERMNQSDRANSRRLVRAIEVASNRHLSSSGRTPAFDVCWIGLTASKELLAKRIAGRVQARIDAGFDNEVDRLSSRYPAFLALPTGKTIGYYQWGKYLAGDWTMTEAVEKWTLAEIQYMKRQFTWFNKNPAIIWFDIAEKTCYAQVSNHARRWLTYGSE